MAGAPGVTGSVWSRSVPDGSAVPLMRWEQASRYGAAVAVTTRHGGVSRPPYDTLNLGLHVGDRPADVAANRARAAAAFGVDPASLVFARQVHGAVAAVVGAADAGRGVGADDDAVQDTDILVTATTGLTLVVLVADCVPLALVDREARVLAVVHAGWRGTAAGAVPAALDAMAGLGARPGRVRAFLGPAVAPERYQVGAAVRDALAASVRPAALPERAAAPDGPGHWLVDLVAVNRQQLLAGGVRDEHVVVSGATTAHGTFFSDRAQRPCGRFALLARLVD